MLVEFQEVLRRRRMVRSYAEDRPISGPVVDRIVRNALRAPSAGFSQGWGFLIIDRQADIARFRAAVSPEENADAWFATTVRTPLLIVPHANKDAYLDRYAMADKGFSDRADDWWPAPYWDIDVGFASLLMLLTAVDEGLGACFFAIPRERIAAFRAAFGVPERYRPIGAISIGYAEEPSQDLRKWRRPASEVVHRGRWGQPGA